MKNETTEKVQSISITEIQPFHDHPFTVADNEDMAKIVESIGKVGTITPLLARPLPDGGYELISGHRRLEACRKLRLYTIPVIVREMTDDEAVIAMVDEERIAFSVGVELSYLDEYEQQDLLEAIELEDKTPSLSQAIQMKKLSQSGRLDSETIEKIISEDKPNQREKISFQYDELSKYFPKCSPQEVQRRMMKLAQADYQRRVRNRNREAR